MVIKADNLGTISMPEHRPEGAAKGYKYRKTTSLPKATIGECFNSERCKNFYVDLADGLCVKCWDRQSHSMSFFRKQSRKANAKRKKAKMPFL